MSSTATATVANWEKPTNGTVIVLVGCCNEKCPGSHPAKDLFLSDLFKKGRAFAETQGDHWFILSGKYGVLDPEEVVETYDVNLVKADKSDQRTWAIGSAGMLIGHLTRLRVFGEIHIVLLCGSVYAQVIEHVQRSSNYLGTSLSFQFHFHQPLEGLGIGQRLAWLNSNLAGLKAQTGGQTA